MTTDGSSLSNENPLATVDQRALEDRALRLLKQPELERARTLVTELWRHGVTHLEMTKDQMSRCEPMIDEYMFHHAILAADADGCYPKVARYMAPPHHWFGREVPGSRWAGDSPDFIYRTIPIEHGYSYEIRGRRTCADPPTATYSLWADTTAHPVIQNLLDSLDMDTDDDGGFVITVDTTPADGRPNHIQTKPGASHLMIRDAIGDWLNQNPNALTPVRLSGPDRAPLTDEHLAQRAAQHLLEGFYYTYYTTQSGAGQPPNQLRQPGSAGMFGGMPTQWGTKGNLHLEDDEALIVTSSSAGARFRNTVLCDAFHLSLNYWSHTGSLNMNQMAADEDGSFTYVVAHEDPGVHNWLDTGGLTRCLYGHRWQAFPRDGSGGAPTISARTVKFDAVERELPEGVRRIDDAGRRAQIAQREAGFRRRFIDS
jgi:hypothetical protein